MQVFGVSENEMTPAELFEDFHQRMGLRNKISNALVAISLFRAKSPSKNLPRYIEDGLDIAEECVQVLGEISEKDSDYRYRSYVSKVIVDLLTDRLLRNPDEVKLKELRQKFNSVKDVFETMQSGGSLTGEKVHLAEQTIKDIDTEIESAYAGEENLYRGSFVPR